ncbi:MAG TPA: GxxExxY protein [Gemmatimonadales bacterium]|jgi:GxxExxY protein|nr:GxxExxY protein [Gemmatimonadales bacterium]
MPRFIPPQYSVRHGHQFEPLSAKVIGAALSVHKALGPGFTESAYQNAMCVALGRRGLDFETQRTIKVHFEGIEVGEYRLDLVVGHQVVVELKSVKALSDLHFAQIRAYLKASKLPVGLLINFNEPVLKVRRVVN